MQRGLDDRRADDRQLPRVGRDQRALADRLAERVGVAPAERAGALAAALDELVADPLVAQDLRPRAGGRAARGADGALGLLDEAVLVDRQPRLGLDVAAPGARGVELGVEVQPGLAGRGARRLLEHQAGALARGVGGADVDEVRVAAGLAQRFEQARRALAVELERLVQRLLEGDARGAVDDDVDVAGQVEVVVAEVAADGLDVGAVEALERGGGEDLVLEPVVGVAAQQDRDRRLGQLADDLGQHGLADEPGGAGQQQRFPASRSRNVSDWTGPGPYHPSLLTCQ